MTFNQLLTLALQARREWWLSDQRQFWYAIDSLAVECKVALDRARIGQATVKALRDLACS